MTPEQAKIVLRALLAANPRATIDEDSVLLYARALGRFRYATGEEAALKLAETKPGFPALATLVQACDEIEGTFKPKPRRREIPQDRETMCAVGKDGVRKARQAMKPKQPWATRLDQEATTDEDFPAIRTG